MRIDLDALSGLTSPQPSKTFLHYMREILPRVSFTLFTPKASKIDTNCGRNLGHLFGVNESLWCGWILTEKTMTEPAILRQFDKELSKRAWGSETPRPPSIHREHGWYLPNDD